MDQPDACKPVAAGGDPVCAVLMDGQSLSGADDATESSSSGSLSSAAGAATLPTQTPLLLLLFVVVLGAVLARRTYLALASHWRSGTASPGSLSPCSSSISLTSIKDASQPALELHGSYPQTPPPDPSYVPSSRPQPYPATDRFAAKQAQPPLLSEAKHAQPPSMHSRQACAAKQAQPPLLSEAKHAQPPSMHSRQACAAKQAQPPLPSEAQPEQACPPSQPSAYEPLPASCPAHIPAWRRFLDNPATNSSNTTNATTNSRENARAGAPVPAARSPAAYAQAVCGARVLDAVQTSTLSLMGVALLLLLSSPSSLHSPVMLTLLPAIAAPPCGPPPARTPLLLNVQLLPGFQRVCRGLAWWLGEDAATACSAHVDPAGTVAAAAAAAAGRAGKEGLAWPVVAKLLLDCGCVMGALCGGLLGLWQGQVHTPCAQALQATTTLLLMSFKALAALVLAIVQPLHTSHTSMSCLCTLLAACLQPGSHVLFATQVAAAASLVAAVHWGGSLALQPPAPGLVTLLCACAHLLTVMPCALCLRWAWGPPAGPPPWPGARGRGRRHAASSKGGSRARSSIMTRGTGPGTHFGSSQGTQSASLGPWGSTSPQCSDGSDGPAPHRSPAHRGPGAGPATLLGSGGSGAGAAGAPQPHWDEPMEGARAEARHEASLVTHVSAGLSGVRLQPGPLGSGGRGARQQQAAGPCDVVGPCDMVVGGAGPWKAEMQLRGEQRDAWGLARVLLDGHHPGWQQGQGQQQQQGQQQEGQQQRWGEQQCQQQVVGPHTSTGGRQLSSEYASGVVGVGSEGRKALSVHASGACPLSPASSDPAQPASSVTVTSYAPSRLTPCPSATPPHLSPKASATPHLSGAHAATASAAAQQGGSGRDDSWAVLLAPLPGAAGQPQLQQQVRFDRGREQDTGGSRSGSCGITHAASEPPLARQATSQWASKAPQPSSQATADAAGQLPLPSRGLLQGYQLMQADVEAYDTRLAALRAVSPAAAKASSPAAGVGRGVGLRVHPYAPYYRPPSMSPLRPSPPPQQQQHARNPYHHSQPLLPPQQQEQQQRQSNSGSRSDHSFRAAMIAAKARGEVVWTVFDGTGGAATSSRMT